jgi:hypothetical protein
MARTNRTQRIQGGRIQPIPAAALRSRLLHDVSTRQLKDFIRYVRYYLTR